MKKNLLSTATLIIALTMSLLGSCSSATTDNGQGQIQVYVTDAPSSEVTAVEIQAGAIEIHRAGTTEGEWVILMENPPAFDLMQVTGIESLLGTANVTSGNYTQVRLTITSVTVTINGEKKSADVPSDKLKFVGNITVETGKVTSIGFDFDAQKSVIIKGNGEVALKPVVKLLGGRPGKGLEGVIETTPSPTPTDTTSDNASGE